MNNFSFLCTLITFTIFLTIASVTLKELEISKENWNALSKEKRLKFKELESFGIKTNVDDDSSANREPNLKKSKVVRVKLLMDKSQPEERDFSRLFDRKYGKTRDPNEIGVERFRRNATGLNEVKTSKKGYKKLKLAQAEYSRNQMSAGQDFLGEKRTEKKKKKMVKRRHVELWKIRSKRYAVSRSFTDDKSDYYAQRKAVMERFYTRQKEIAEKYARKMATTPKYIYKFDEESETDKSDSVGGNKTDTNNIERAESTMRSNNNEVDHGILISSTTESYKDNAKGKSVENENSKKNTQIVDNSSEDNVEEDTSDDYDYYTVEDKLKQMSAGTFEDNGTLNDAEWDADNNRPDTLKWGNCAGKLVYQHNLIIGVHKAALADADLTTSLEGPFCVTCIRVVPANENRATVSLDVNREENGHLRSVKLRFKGFQDAELSYIVKVWAVSKKNDRCDHI